MILEAGAYVNAVTPDGRTPLSCAVDHPKVVSVLLKAGADRSIKQEGRTIMDIAKQESFMHSKGRSDTVALLHEAEQLELHQRIAQRRAMEPPDEAKLRLGPMLHEACKAGKLDDANKCIQDEADVTWADEKGRSSCGLHAAWGARAAHVSYYRAARWSTRLIRTARRLLSPRANTVKWIASSSF